MVSSVWLYLRPRCRVVVSSVKPAVIQTGLASLYQPDTQLVIAFSDIQVRPRLFQVCGTNFGIQVKEMRLSVDFGTLDSAGIWRCAAIMEVGSMSPTSTKINKLPVRPLAGPGLTIKIGRPRSQTPPVLPLPVRLQTVGIPARAGNRFAA